MPIYSDWQDQEAEGPPRELPPPPSSAQEALVSAIQEPKGLSTPWRLAPVIGQSADGIATYMNLKSGGEEYNPALKGLAKASPEALLAFKVAQGLGTQALANWLHKKYGDRKGGKLLAKTLAGVSAGQGAYGAGYSFAHRDGKK